MFSLLGRNTCVCDRINRRELLRIGGLAAPGLALATLLASRTAATTTTGDRTFGRAKNVIYLWLQGGPPQHETFDPKPEAPVEIRGAFQPIATNIPGIHFCELLPRTAAIADKLAIVRSVSTDDNLHDGSGYWLLTGRKYAGPNSREIRATDWPYFGSLVKMLRPSEELPALTSVWLPDVMRLNDNVQPAGQTAGFLGGHWEPQRFVCDPSRRDFKINGLAPPADIPPLRLSHRVSLLHQVEQHFAQWERSGRASQYDQSQHEALDLLTSGRAREAFAIQREPEAVRDRYGRNRFGQCVLLARRLIEAGVRLVHVNWPREPGDTAVDNPMWDTHAQNADRLEDVLCPLFDVAFTALVDDLHDRALLDETLVVAVGEFGRTPKINRHGGRDHWGPVFSLALAGAGISGAQVYGASDKIGAYPVADRVQPPDFVATLFHLLGVDHHATFADLAGRVLPVTTGQPIYKLLGTSPVTTARTQPGGDIARVPPYDDRPLRNTDFAAPGPLHEIGAAGRIKGWQARSFAPPGHEGQLVVEMIDERAPSVERGTRCVRIGIDANAAGRSPFVQGMRALLTQEVRSPRAGHYTFTVHASGGGTSREVYADWFLRHFACRLAIVGYLDLNKDPTHVRQFATVPFEPPFVAHGATDRHRFSVTVALRSQDDGAMETSMGVGVAVIVENSLRDALDWPGGAAAWISLHDTELTFDARPRDETVKV